MASIKSKVPLSLAVPQLEELQGLIDLQRKRTFPINHISKKKKKYRKIFLRDKKSGTIFLIIIKKNLCVQTSENCFPKNLISSFIFFKDVESMIFLRCFMINQACIRNQLFVFHPHFDSELLFFVHKKIFNLFFFKINNSKTNLKNFSTRYRQDHFV